MSSSSELTSVTLTNDVRSLLPGAGTVLPPEISHIHKFCRKSFFQIFFLNLFLILCFYIFYRNYFPYYRRIAARFSKNNRKVNEFEHKFLTICRN